MRERIKRALEEAIRTKDPVRISTLRLMLTAIRDRDVALRSDEDVSGTEIEEGEITELLSTMVRQREESAEAYSQAGRMELAAREEAEIGIIREFMPKRMSEAEIRSAISEAIGETGAGSIRDMGRVMGHLKERYPGRMDFGAAGAKVKQQLG